MNFHWIGECAFVCVSIENSKSDKRRCFLMTCRTNAAGVCALCSQRQALHMQQRTHTMRFTSARLAHPFAFCNIFCIFNLSFTNSWEIYIMIVWQYVSMDCIPINLEMAMATRRKRKIVNNERASSLLLASACWTCSKSTSFGQTPRVVCSRQFGGWWWLCSQRRRQKDVHIFTEHVLMKINNKSFSSRCNVCVLCRMSVKYFMGSVARLVRRYPYRG